MRISTRLAGCALAALLVSPALAGTGDILVGLDNSVVFGPEGTGYRAPGRDSVLVLDASDPAHPRIKANLPLSNSVLGPPTNLQITPDGMLGLVTSAVHTERKDGTWAPVPDNALHVIDLSGKAPRFIGDVGVGRQPSGMAISRDGTLALVANSAGKSISVLRIEGKKVTAVSEIPVGDTTVSVAITPDGSRAFFTKSAAGKVGVLAIKGDQVTYNPDDDIPAGVNTVNIAVTVDGAAAIALNAPTKGNSGFLNIIDARAPHPHTIDTVALPDGPEGMALSPDGRSGAVLVLHGGTAPHNDWSYHRNGGMLALRIDGTRVSVVPGEVPMGAVPEGIAFSHDGRFVYAADFNDKVLHVIAMENGVLRDTGTRLNLPGPPASMRGAAF